MDNREGAMSMKKHPHFRERHVTAYCPNCQESIAMTQTVPAHLWHLVSAVLLGAGISIVSGVMWLFVWLYSAASWRSPPVCPKCHQPEVGSKKDKAERRLLWAGGVTIVLGLVIAWSISPAAASDLKEEIANEIVECRRASETFHGTVPGPYSREMKTIILHLKLSDDFKELVDSVAEMVKDMPESERRETYGILFPTCAAVRAETGL